MNQLETFIDWLLKIAANIRERFSFTASVEPSERGMDRLQVLSSSITGANLSVFSFRCGVHSTTGESLFP